MSDFIKHTINAAGSLFIARDSIKDSTFPPGTKGCNSFIMGPDSANPNIVFHKVITTRRGMKGKPRLEFDVILSQIFDVPALEEFYNDEETDRKGFVSIDTTSELNNTLIQRTRDDDVTFIASILSRGIFAKELDNKTYSHENMVMQKVGLYDYKEMNVWPKKDTLLNKLVSSTLSWFGHGDFEHVRGLFCTKEGKKAVLAELIDVETRLMIPRLVYQRKINTVLQDAIKEVQRRLNDNNIKNKGELLKLAKNTKQILKSQDHKLLTLINERLSNIVGKRKLVNI